MNSEHCSHLFNHRVVPDIRIQDMHLETEFQLQQTLYANPNCEEREAYEQYEWMAYCSLNQFVTLSKREFPPTTNTEAISQVVAMVAGPPWSDFDPVTEYHVNWFAGFGMIIATSAMPPDESQLPTIRGLHIGVMVRVLEIAEPPYRRFCALALQQGYREQALRRSEWSLTQS